MSFDYQKAMSVVENDKDLFNELFQIFLEDKDNTFSQIESALQENKSEIVERSAHSLKGALSNLGATTAVESAYTLEKLAHSNDALSIKAAFDELKNQINNFIEKVKESEDLK